MDRNSIIGLDKKYIWHPYTAMDEYIQSTDPLVIAHAEGPYITDINGERYIDANGSWWVSTLGHRHPRLVNALTKQAQTLAHCSLAGCTHEPAARLAERLVAIAPGSGELELNSSERLNRVFFSDNGSTAVEVGIKASVQFWRQNGKPQKSGFLSLTNAFHGETVGVASVGGIAEFRSVFEPILFPTVHLSVPRSVGSEWEKTLQDLEQTLASHHERMAALVMEPLIQGAAGMLIHPEEFVRQVRHLTRKYDVLLIADEVFTGLGRTGDDFACTRSNVVPDVLCLAKALSGGLLPFAATLFSQRIFEGFLGDKSRALMYGHSYCGNPLGAAVALESLSVYQDECIKQQVQRKAPVIAQVFERIAHTVKGVTDVRCCGMVAAVDLGEGGYLSGLGWKVFAHARKQEVYLRPLGNTVYIAPALNIPDDVLLRLLTVVEESVTTVMTT